MTYTLASPKNHRRVDLVASLPTFLLGIETKKFTRDSREQIEDYCRHLENIAGDRPFCLVFLSPTGMEATFSDPTLSSVYKRNNQLKSWSWETDIPKWLEGCRGICKSEKLRHFISDFRDYISAYLSSGKYTIEDYDNQ